MDFRRQFTWAEVYSKSVNDIIYEMIGRLKVKLWRMEKELSTKTRSIKKIKRILFSLLIDSCILSEFHSTILLRMMNKNDFTADIHCQGRLSSLGISEMLNWCQFLNISWEPTKCLIKHINFQAIPRQISHFHVYFFLDYFQ